MPLPLETLVFLCSCLRPYPCMLGCANGVDLLPEHMCLHTEVESALFEAETDSHDNCLTEVVDCVLTVDMSLRRESDYSHTCDKDASESHFALTFDAFRPHQDEESDKILVIPSS